MYDILQNTSTVVWGPFGVQLEDQGEWGTCFGCKIKGKEDAKKLSNQDK